MLSYEEEAVEYLKKHVFVPHKMGNWGTYGLHFLGARSVIQMNGKLWKFLYWSGKNEEATFINADSDIITFCPRTVYYSDKRDEITRMDEIKDT